MPYQVHTVTRFVTTHTDEDRDGSNVTVIRDNLSLQPFLNGSGQRTQIFTHLSGPAVSDHSIDREGIDKANQLTTHVTLENGVSSGVTDFAPDTIIGQHRTDSIDHAVILHGSVTMTYSTNGNEKAVVMRAGDVVIQRGTTHGWKAGPDGVRFFSVMIHARPIVVPGSNEVLKEFW